MVNAQEWLDENYPSEERNEVKSLDIGGKNLEGELKIERFNNLERIDGYHNQLVSLHFVNCPNLVEICCYKNQLTNLRIDNCPKLNYLNISCNLFENFDFLNYLS